MALASLNYFAMVLGYISLFFIALIIVLFAYLYIREKYANWKWKKERGERQRRHEEKNMAQQKEATPEAANIPENQETQ